MFCTTGTNRDLKRGSSSKPLETSGLRTQNCLMCTRGFSRENYWESPSITACSKTKKDLMRTVHGRDVWFSKNLEKKSSEWGKE